MQLLGDEMPTDQEILAGLTAIANDWMALAIAWHAAITLVFIAVIVGWRPSYRATLSLVAVLPASVAVMAIVYRNPFNGIVFASLAIALALLARRESAEPVGRGSTWAWLGGLAMIAFAWTYPHFLVGNPLLYFAAAPVGLVPCPTLSMAIGLVLLVDAGVSRPARWTLAGAALFYALFGVFKLGVVLDLGLLAAAAMLIAGAIRREARSRAGSQPSGRRITRDTACSLL